MSEEEKKLNAKQKKMLNSQMEKQYSLVRKLYNAFFPLLNLAARTFGIHNQNFLTTIYFLSLVVVDGIFGGIITIFLADMKSSKPVPQ